MSPNPDPALISNVADFFPTMCESFKGQRLTIRPQTTDGTLKNGRKYPNLSQPEKFFSCAPTL